MTRMEKRLFWWNVGFTGAFALLGLLGAWWTILITRLIERNFELTTLLYGVDPSLAESHYRQRVMMLGESSLLLTLAVTLIALAWRQAQRERAQIRRLEGMLAASTHELKTPVAAVRALLESLQNGVLPPEKAGPYLVKGIDACGHLEHLIEGILSYQAAMARHTELQAIPLKNLVEAVLEHRLGSVHGEQIVCELGALGERSVQAAEDPVRVILENLLDNARKYGAGKPVRLSAVEEGAWLSLLVSDEGSGFASEEAAQLFEPYQRGQSGRRIHGTGLGLYLARGLARSMGGELVARSDGPGKGACFSLRLRLR